MKVIKTVSLIASAFEFEIEELILYPSVKRKINKYGLKYYSAYTPERVPQERI